MTTLRFEPMMESRPIREIAYEVLKHAIITGEIPAGERIVETDYAERLHISRTPLREALRKLERDGLVEDIRAGAAALSCARSPWRTWTKSTPSATRWKC